MKKQTLFIMTALVIGLTACGGNDNKVVGNNNTTYRPGDRYTIPTNPSSGTFSSTEDWMVSQFQAIYGNVKTDHSAIFGTTTLAVGSYSWQTILDRVKTAATACGNSCQLPTYGYNQYLSPLARINFNQLRAYLNFSALSNVGVQYANDPGYSGYSLAHSVDQVLSILSQSYGQMINQYYGYGSYYTYNPWYSGSGMNLGVNSSGGQGLSISVGGNFGW
ncbi:MAG: hypothetical protein ABIR96_08475 [Bdellovibrionota bacterium]